MTYEEGCDEHSTTETRPRTRLRLRRACPHRRDLVGLGLGILLDDFFAWFLIGIGAGFILMAFIAALGK